MADVSRSPFPDQASFDPPIEADEIAAYEQFRRDYPARDGVGLPTSSSPVGHAPIEADRQMYFEVYRADRVSLTSILFSGGDWRWRFCMADGAVIAGSEGYRSEAVCLRAVEALRHNAGAASFRQRPRTVGRSEGRRSR